MRCGRGEATGAMWSSKETLNGASSLVCGDWGAVEDAEESGKAIGTLSRW